MAISSLQLCSGILPHFVTGVGPAEVTGTSSSIFDLEYDRFDGHTPNFCYGL